tara:strand:- start:444 stop:821 length:378 start_codon:yes stop_codon:yes gene_type:complete
MVITPEKRLLIFNRNKRIIREKTTLLKRMKKKGARFPNKFPYSLHTTKEGKLRELNAQINSLRAWFGEQRRDRIGLLNIEERAKVSLGLLNRREVKKISYKKTKESGLIRESMVKTRKTKKRRKK